MKIITTNESRERYCYTTGTEPFKSRYENLSTEMISVSIATRGLVKDAIGQYGKDYGNGNGFEIFSEDDFKECVAKIINDVNEDSGNTNIEFIIGDGYLKAISKGADIANIRIFDLNGRNRYIADVDSTSLTVNTTQWQNSVIIVDVQLSDNTHATIKLSI